MPSQSKEHLKLMNISPADEYNDSLVANTHPEEWKNPTPKKIYDAVVIGAGTAGLVTAAGIAGLGGDVALIEKHMMGGDCLNVGCVPSKALIRSSRVAASIRDAKGFGIKVDGKQIVDFPEVMKRLRRLRTQISPNDSVERFSELGIDVFLGHGEFSSNNTIEVDGVTLNFRKAMIATGGKPFVPNIPGLDTVEWYTNETIFNLTELPEKLLVVGGGPIGSELAQSLARLGSKVTQIDISDRILSRDDPDASKILMESFKKDGIQLLLNSRLTEFVVNDGKKYAVIKNSLEETSVEIDAVLLAVGRRPNLKNLNLDKAGVKADESGKIQIDDFFRTTNSNVYSAGDVASKFQFTHAADAMSRAVIANAFFFGRGKHSDLIIPWTTYTSPEIAGVGINLKTAQENDSNASEIIIDFSDLDRAILDGEENGFLKVIHDKKGKILGATIVAEHAGDLIGEVVMAMKHNITLSHISSIIHPYPSQGEAIKRAGDAFRRGLLTPRIAKILRWMIRRRK
jgi:pyruvate/2-oxoglutarate dehydrogenase complex dihydrolipoamide dehydrogenase (E3) component